MSLWVAAERTRDRAKIGVETCRELVDLLWSGKHPLGQGAPADTAGAAKRASHEADAGVAQGVQSAIAALELSAAKLKEVVTSPLLPGSDAAADLGQVGELHRERAEVYRKVLALLAEPPGVLPAVAVERGAPRAPPMSAAERGVATVRQVRDGSGWRRPDTGTTLIDPAAAPGRRKRLPREHSCFCNSCSMFQDEDRQEAVSAPLLLDARTRRRRRLGRTVGGPRLEDLVDELFNLHDLNSDGVLEEAELIRLNERIARLHHGKHADKEAVRTKYRGLFRDKLDPDGQPVPFATFRSFMLELLAELDPHEEAQEMIAEQFVAEAQTARATLAARDLPGLPQAPSFTVTEVSVSTEGCVPAGAAPDAAKSANVAKACI